MRSFVAIQDEMVAGNLGSAAKMCARAYINRGIGSVIGVFEHGGDEHHSEECSHTVLVGSDLARSVEVGPQDTEKPLDQHVDVDVVAQKTLLLGNP